MLYTHTHTHPPPPPPPPHGTTTIHYCLIYVQNIYIFCHLYIYIYFLITRNIYCLENTRNHCLLPCTDRGFGETISTMEVVSCMGNTQPLKTTVLPPLEPVLHPLESVLHQQELCHTWSVPLHPAKVAGMENDAVLCGPTATPHSNHILLNET